MMTMLMMMMMIAAMEPSSSPSFSSSWQFWILLLFVIFTIRTIYVLRIIQRHRASLDNRALLASQTTTITIKTLVVLGSGGHTTEMLALLKNVDATIYTPLIYMIATTDDTSLQRVQASSSTRMPNAIYKLPRSREVGQSYFSSIFTTLWSFLISIYYIARIRPDLLLCNGPGTCLPVAISTLLFRILGVCRGNVVFCESFCRVTSLSLTGRLLYPFADLFVVHWEELGQIYPNCTVISTFVPNNSNTSRVAKKES